MRTLIDRFRNATVAGFKDRGLFSTIANRASLSRQRKATELEVGKRVQQPSRSQITTPTRSIIPNAYDGTSAFRTRSGGPLCKHNSSVALRVIFRL